MAHLLELPNKLNLSKDNYQSVQQIYRGWSWLGILEIGAILLTLIWTIKERKNKKIFPFLLTALVFFIVSIVTFFVFTFPSNTVTENWTQLPQDWQVLRKKWEYSHATRAILNLMGFNFLMVALLKERNGHTPKPTNK